VAAPLRFFPPAALAPPHINGNGHSPAPATEAKALVYSNFYPIDATGGTTTDLGLGNRLDWYALSWLAYACMRYRSTKLVEAPLWIAEEKDGADEWLQGDHPLAELLERPNADMEMSDLLELTSQYYDATGAALWVKNRGRAGRVESLYAFSADDFTVESANGLLRGRFRVNSYTGQRTLGPDDVILFGSTSPSDPRRFVGPLDAAAARLGIDRDLVGAIKAGLRNAVVPGFMISYPDGLNVTPEQKQDLKAQLAQGFASARNHGKPLVLEGGATGTQFTLGFAGLQGGELSKEVEAAVCACFQVPPAVIGAFVGLVNSSDRHNMEAAISLFYDNAIRPTWSRMEKALTRGLLREVDPNPLRFVRFDKTEIAALRADQGAQADIIQKAGRALTVNDARSMLDLAPLEDERGDELMSVAVPPGMPGALPPALAVVKRAPATPEQKSRATRWLLWDAVTRAHEYGWTLAAASQLEADKATVLEILNSRKSGNAPPERKDPPPIGPADAGLVRELIARMQAAIDQRSADWLARLMPLAEMSGRAAVERMAAELGISFDLLQPGLLEYVQKEAAWLVTQVGDTTKQAIRDELAAGLLEGEGIPEMAKRIEGAGAFSRSRAELIARSEVTRVSNGASHDSMTSYVAENGGTVTKSWLTAGDSRVRDAHAAMEGETRPLGEAFSNGEMYPSEPNCRCAITHSLEG
jgi:HK97 family phage portal protein